MIISTFPLNKAGYTWQIIININDSSESEYSAHIAKLGNFKIGSDDDTDLIYYPSNFNPTIIPLPYTLETYNLILDKLGTYSSTAIIKRNGEDYYKGNLYERVYGNPIEKTIKLKIVDRLRDLRAVNPASNPLGLPLGGNVSTVIGLIKDVLNYGADEEHVALVTCNSPLQVESELEQYSGGPYYIGTIDGNYPNIPDNLTYRYYLAVYQSFYFRSTNNQYKSLVDVVKSLLSSFGCVGAFLPFGEFAIVSRFANPDSELITMGFNDYETIDDETIPSFVSMKSRVQTGSPGVYQEKIEGNTNLDLINKDRYEELIIDHAGGTLPDGSSSYIGVGVIIPPPA